MKSSSIFGFPGSHHTSQFHRSPSPNDIAPVSNNKMEIVQNDMDLKLVDEHSDGEAHNDAYFVVDNSDESH